MQILLNRTFSLLFIGACLFYSSCSHYYYAPNEGQLMALSEAGDVKISGGIGKGKGKKFPSEQERFRKDYNLQLGLSPINHIGVQGSFFHLESIIDIDYYPGAHVPGGDGHLSELAVGYYSSLNKNAPHIQEGNAWLGDLYAGTGWGEIHNYYSTTGESHLKFRRHFLSAGLHYNHQKKLVLDFGLRFSSVSYQKADLYGKIPFDQNNQIAFIKTINPIMMLEPSFRIQMGIRPIKCFLSTNFTSDLLNPSNLSNDEFLYSSFTGNIGIIIEPDEFFRKKK